MFNSQHPIVCSPMNGVSDLKLAIACAQAGIVPSLFLHPYTNLADFSKSVTEVLSHCSNIHVSSSLKDITINAELIKKLGITHIEILEFENNDVSIDNKKIINDLRAAGIKVILKILLTHVIDQFIDIIDAVTIKGSEGAGRSAKDIKLEDAILDIKSKYPSLKIIASGGVKNKSDIESLLSLGACAVSIGTLFALSKESPIPNTVKNKLLQSTSDDIRRLKTGARQRAIIFDEQASDDFNNTNGLYSGLRTGTTGHIFVGNALDSITEILSVQEIVDCLVS
jgi:NAD(P)H-dependent flavin oxidoreductase YrpB (nitropropane dioxygenase family)